MALKVVEVTSEAELEELVVQNLDKLWEGSELKLLSRQLRVEAGVIDLLCATQYGALAVLEVKLHSDTNQLFQAIQYYDWVYENRAALAHFYSQVPGVKIDIYSEPWIVLIAREFPRELITIVKHLKRPVRLVRYICIEDAQGNRSLVFVEVPVYEPRGPPPKPPQIDDHINYVYRERVRELLKRFLDNIDNLGEDIELYATRSYIGISTKKWGLIACIYPRTEYFHVSVGDREIRNIDSEVKLQEALEAIKEFYEEIKT